MPVKKSMGYSTGFSMGNSTGYDMVIPWVIPLVVIWVIPWVIPLVMIWVVTWFIPLVMILVVTWFIPLVMILVMTWFTMVVVWSLGLCCLRPSRAAEDLPHQQAFRRWHNIRKALDPIPRTRPTNSGSSLVIQVRKNDYKICYEQ